MKFLLEIFFSYQIQLKIFGKCLFFDGKNYFWPKKKNVFKFKLYIGLVYFFSI